MSNRLIDINTKMQQIYISIAELEKEYEGKIKGEVYRKRKLLLKDKKEYLVKKAKSIGCGYNVCFIKGKRRRPNKRNPTISTLVDFTLVFVGVDRKELPYLLEYKYKNIISYEVQFLTSGEIIER